MQILLVSVFSIVLSTFMLRDRISQTDNSIVKKNIELSNDSSFIEGIKNNEHYYIIFARTDCFPKKTERKVIKISKENNLYFATYQGSKKELADRQVLLLKDFEKKLDQYAKVERCTAGEKYMLLYNNKTKTRIDFSCSWHGFEKLTADLF